jgi:hypothetical protein
MVQAVDAPASLFAESLDGIQAVQGSKLRSLLLRSLQVFGEPGLLPGQVSQLGLHYLLLLAVSHEELDEPSLVLSNLRDLLLQMVSFAKTRPAGNSLIYRL